MCRKYKPGWFAKARDKWINKNAAKISCYLGDGAYSGSYTANFLTHSTEIYSCGLHTCRKLGHREAPIYSPMALGKNPHVKRKDTMDVNNVPKLFVVVVIVILILLVLGLPTASIFWSGSSSVSTSPEQTVVLTFADNRKPDTVRVTNISHMLTNHDIGYLGLGGVTAIDLNGHRYLNVLDITHLTAKTTVVPTGEKK